MMAAIQKTTPGQCCVVQQRSAFGRQAHPVGEAWGVGYTNFVTCEDQLTPHGRAGRKSTGSGGGHRNRRQLLNTSPIL